MPKRRIILVFVLCVSIAVYAVQAMSRTADSNRTRKSSNASRLRNMSEAERKREAAKRRRQHELKQKEFAKESHGRLIDREKRRKEAQERLAKRKKEFLMEKSALKATEEQWKLIKPKLEKVRLLRDLERSTVNLGLTSSSGSRSVPTWKWRISWKDKPPAELTEAQKIAQELFALV